MVYTGTTDAFHTPTQGIIGPPAKDLLRYPLVKEGVYAWLACLPSSFHAKSKLYCGPYGHTASIFYGIWIKQSVAMAFRFNLDKLSLKKLFPTMNI